MIALPPGGSLYLYCRLRWHTTRRVILSYCQLRQYHYPKGTQKITMLLDWKHYLHLVPRISSREKNHASQVNIHASRKIRHFRKKHASWEGIHMSRNMSCTARRYSCIDEDQALRKSSHTLQEEIHALRRRSHALKEKIHASQKIMHCGEVMHCKNRIHASRGNIMHHIKSCITRRYSCIEEKSCIARGEFMHRRNKSCIAREKFMHRGKKSCIAREFMHCGKVTHHKRRNSCIVEMSCLVEKKSCTTREGNRKSQEKYLLIIRNEISPIFFILTRLNIKKTIKDDIKKKVNTALAFIYFDIKKYYIEDYITNIRHKLYSLYVEPIELTSNVKGEKLSDNTVKDTISYLNCIFMIMSLSQYVSRVSGRMNSPKMNHRFERHQQGCSTT